MAQNSAFDEHKDELEHYEQMFGRDRGRLAVSLDRLTNALVLVGQHGVYCTSQRNPTVPAMDLRMVVQELTREGYCVIRAMWCSRRFSLALRFLSSSRPAGPHCARNGRKLSSRDCRTRSGYKRFSRKSLCSAISPARSSRARPVFSRSLFN